LTDAYVIAGYLNSEYLLGGDLRIEKGLAEHALQSIARRFKVTIEEAADSIIRIANDQAARVIRQISVQKGYDPRDFTLVAHGGSGPMFAPFIASELSIPRVVVPGVPAGVFNAWGMLAADVRHDLIRTSIVKVGELRETCDFVNSTYQDLESQLLMIFASEHLERSRISIVRYADMRYYGQEHTIKVALPSRNYNPHNMRELEGRFVKAHQREYGFVLPGNAVELVTFHVVGLSKVKKPSIRPLTKTGRSVKRAYVSERRLYVGSGRFRTVPVYKRELLPPDASLRGPTIIEESTSTIIVTEGLRSKLDGYGNVIIVPSRKR
jgi:N-methylhydantoinase A